MNKSAFVEKMMASDKFASKKEAEIALSVVLDTIVDSVANEDGVTFVGFGSFIPKRKESREAFNPRTKEKISIPEKVVPAFKAGSSFKDAVNK